MVTLHYQSTNDKVGGELNYTLIFSFYEFQNGVRMATLEKSPSRLGNVNVFCAFTVCRPMKSAAFDVTAEGTRDIRLQEVMIL